MTSRVRVERPLTVLQLHNFYRWGGTGENDAVRATCDLLRSRGQVVHEITRDSRAAGSGVAARIGLAASGLWSRAAHAEVVDLIRRARPDVAHVHNVYPMLSPSVIAACREMEVPVVMTCHNHRLICPTAGVFRDGQICTKCTGAGREAWCVVHNCRGNLAESAAYALRSVSARLVGTFATDIDRYIAPSRFTADMLRQSGLPAERVDVIPCMVPTHPPSPRDPLERSYAAFAGRLSDEKGLDVLLQASALLPDIPVRIAGDGPLRERLTRDAPANVSFEGYLPSDALATFYRGARFAVVPSLWYETFGLVPAEAMSHGLAVIASRFGALPELVADRDTGLLFERGNAAELARQMATLWSRPDLCAAMGERGRAAIAARCSPDEHWRRLRATYAHAMAAHGTVIESIRIEKRRSA